MASEIAEEVDCPESVGGAWVDSGRMRVVEKACSGGTAPSIATGLCYCSRTAGCTEGKRCPLSLRVTEHVWGKFRSLSHLLNNKKAARCDKDAEGV